MTDAGRLRPMGLLEIIDQTFRLYRRNFWLFCGIAAVVYVPVGFLQGAQQGTRDYPLTIAGFVLLLIGYPFVLGALTKAVSDRYMGDPTTMGSAYAYIARRLWPFVWTMAAAYLLVMGGVLLLVVGALIFAFWVAFVSEVFIIEDKRYFAAVWRSKFLVGNGVWAQVLVLGLLTSILASLIQWVIQGPAILVAGILGEGGTVPWIVGGIASAVAQSVALPIGVVASILLYYDSRVRKEGFDLEVLARELGKALPPPAQPPSPPAPPPPPPPPPPGGVRSS